jgi:hypothetical protein
MNFFSRASETVKPSLQPIPQDILDAVDVMGGRGSNNPSPQFTAPPQGTSPFLSLGSEEKTSIVPRASVSNRVIGDFSGRNPGKFRWQFADWERRRMVMVVGSAVVIALVAALGVWYFLKSSKEEVKTSVGFVPETPVMPVTPTSPQVEPPYAPSAPNYLTIDIETVTPESLGALLSQAGTKMLGASMMGPVEFLLTDKNNNPLAFSRFAYLMNIELPEEFLASLGEPFSLFLYNDNGMVRIGLALTFLDVAKSERLIAARESSLPFLFRTVLFQGSSVARELGLRSGVYKAIPVRFVNIDVTRNISFDYALRGNDWFIGTSKDTLRAMLDKQQ